MLFATERAKGDWALFQMLSHPLFSGRAEVRAVLQAWASPFKREPERLAFVSDDAEYADYSALSARRSPSHEIFANVLTQRDAIKNELAAGNSDRALNYTASLIEMQRRHSEPEHLAKSLCDLAQFAKEIGSIQLQLTFANLATANAPADAWAHATSGDAYRGLGNHQAALDEYQKAGVLGDPRVAILGHAEILKDLGQANESLSLYEQCISEYGDPVARNAQAAALEHFGRLSDALAAYDAIIADSLYDHVAMAGRANVLRHMGRLKEAAGELKGIVDTFPDDPIPVLAYGEVLRELGLPREASDVYLSATAKFPFTFGAHAGYARSLVDLGQFGDAVSVIERASLKFPLSLHPQVALAEVLRRIGDIDRSQAIYESVSREAAPPARARIGLARVYATKEMYEEAVRLLPTHSPATYGDWLGEHVKGLIFMRSGNGSKARDVFERSLDVNPWVRQRPLFEAALATLSLRERRFPDAVRILSDPVVPPWLHSLYAFLRAHAFRELNDYSAARAALSSVQAISTPMERKLREHLLVAIMSPAKSKLGLETSAFYVECDSLLLAA